MAREDLNPVEEARACAALVEELGLTREEVGRARRAQPRRGQQPDAPARPARRGARAARGGALSEGHGRALLLAEDHGARARLARAAPRARAGRCATRGAGPHESNAGPLDAATRSPARRGAGSLHPDQEQACARSPRRSTAALGAEVAVKATRAGGYRAELAFASRRRRRSSWPGGCARARSPASSSILDSGCFAWWECGLRLTAARRARRFGRGCAGPLASDNMAPPGAASAARGAISSVG